MSKKKTKKVSLNNFLAQDGGSSLPSAPGGLSSGPRGRKEYGGRGGNRRNDGGQESRSDARTWRRDGGDRGSSNRRSNYSNDFGSRRDNRRDRDDNNSSRYDDNNISRDNFFGKGQRQRPQRRDRTDGGFSRQRRDRDGGSRRDSPQDSGRELTREAMGKRPVVAIRTRTTRDNFSGRSLNRKKVRGKWDGSENGFGAELVADFFKQDEPTTTETRKTYGIKNVWGEKAGLTEEQQAARDKKVREREESRARDEAEREQNLKAERERKRQKEEEKQRKIDEAARQKAEEERQRELMNTVLDIISEDEKVCELDRQQIEEVVPALQVEDREAINLGKALGLSLISQTMGINGILSYAPQQSHDEIILSMLSTLLFHTGEVDFMHELNNEGIVVQEILHDVTNFEGRCAEFKLNCLILNSDMQNTLEAAFANGADLAELNTIVRGFEDEIPPALAEALFDYVFGTYFSNPEKNAEKYFANSYNLLDFFSIKPGTVDEVSEKRQVQIIEYMIESWFSNEAENDTLFDVFDSLIRLGGVFPESVAQWNISGRFTEAKTFALQTEIPNDEDDRVLMDWLQTVLEDPAYKEEDEDEYEESDDDGMGWG